MTISKLVLLIGVMLLLLAAVGFSAIGPVALLPLGLAVALSAGLVS